MILMAVSAKGFPIEGEMNLLGCYEAAVNIMGSKKKKKITLTNSRSTAKTYRSSLKEIK